MIARLDLALRANLRANRRLRDLTRAQREATKEFHRATLELRAHQTGEKK